MKKFIFVALLLAGACALCVAQSGPIPNTLFGQTFINLNNYNTGIPIGNLGKEILGSWPYVEPNAPVGSGCPGTVNCTHTYNWAALDSYAAKAKANGLFFQWTYDEAPSWPVGGVGCSTPSGNGVVQCTGPLTTSGAVNFGVFIDALVSRYNVGSSIGTIGAYELGNENESDYTGTKAQMAAQFKEMSDHVKAINPSALIVGIGSEAIDTWYASGSLFDQVWTAWKAIGTPHLDAITFHGYPHGYAPVPEIVITGANGVSVGEACSNGYVPCIKALITRNNVTTYAGGTPTIYDTEGSWGTNSLTSTQQIAYIGRSLLLNWAAGVSHQDWYSWDNSQWGCIGCQSANVTAWKQVYNWMAGSTMTQACAIQSGTVWACSLTEPNGTPAKAVWNTAGSSSFIVGAGVYLNYKDLSGGTASISGAATSVPIGIQPILLEGATGAAGLPAAPTGLTATVQ